VVVCGVGGARGGGVAWGAGGASQREVAHLRTGSVMPGGVSERGQRLERGNENERGAVGTNAKAQ
jgi:hypothetical protein